jgi:hypothetical protein
LLLGQELPDDLEVLDPPEPGTHDPSLRVDSALVPDTEVSIPIRGGVLPRVQGLTLGKNYSPKDG